MPVTEFLDELAATNNVVIVTSATSTIDDKGAVFISVFEQGLDFNKKMEKGLINPNKFRSFFKCADDPNDPIMKLVFYAINVFLPL